MSNFVEYRLSWETINAHQAASMEATYGRGVWAQLQPAQWDGLDWHRSGPVVFVRPSGHFAQYETLKAWAESHEQPIRNVRIEKRSAPDPDAGWEAA